MKIRIENPTTGGARFASFAQAKQYIRDGRARLTCENTLRFIDHHHAHRSAEFTAQELADQTWRLSASGYDARGRILTRRELRGIPVVFAQDLLNA